jgi:signal transduction histidine kinase
LKPTPFFGAGFLIYPFYGIIYLIKLKFNKHIYFTKKTKMKIVNDLNLKKQANELGVSVWQTPTFLFIAMGIINVTAMTATYFIAKNYDSPEILILSESIVSMVILFFGGLIVKGVEQMAKLNRAKSEFIALASHQLRTPLSAIKWETELLNSKLKEGLTQRQLEGIKNIGVSTKRMIRLVDDLLDVAKIDQERLTLKKERIDLVKIISETEDNLSTLLKNSEVVLKLNIKNSKKEALALGDSEKIKLAVENLISNSIKYSRKHGKIEVLLRKSNGFWVFSIKDNGIGIPESQQKQVFGKFFRSYNVSRYQAEGTGLGLYIAKTIIEKSGGKIWFKSEENIGSIFSFSLPMA